MDSSMFIYSMEELEMLIYGSEREGYWKNAIFNLFFSSRSSKVKTNDY